MFKVLSAYWESIALLLIILKTQVLTLKGHFALSVWAAAIEFVVVNYNLWRVATLVNLTIH